MFFLGMQVPILLSVHSLISSRKEVVDHEKIAKL